MARQSLPREVRHEDRPSLQELRPYVLLPLLELMIRLDPDTIRIILTALYGPAWGSKLALSYWRGIGKPTPPTFLAGPAAPEMFAKFARQCEENGLLTTAETLKQMVKECPRLDFAAHAATLTSNIQYDLTKGVMLMRIPTDRVRFWDAPALFGEDADARFPEARKDIAEAGNCFAAARYTACVFHLMRVMEWVLRALASTLNVPDPVATDRSWGAILGKVALAIDDVAKQKPKGWRNNGGSIFVAGHGLLGGVQRAWRNQTMHVEGTYDEQDADRIYRAVEVFTAHLAQLPAKA